MMTGYTRQQTPQKTKQKRKNKKKMFDSPPFWVWAAPQLSSTATVRRQQAWRDTPPSERLPFVPYVLPWDAHARGVSTSSIVSNSATRSSHFKHFPLAITSMAVLSLLVDIWKKVTRETKKIKLLWINKNTWHETQPATRLRQTYTYSQLETAAVVR